MKKERSKAGNIFGNLKAPAQNSVKVGSQVLNCYPWNGQKSSGH